MGFRIVPVSNLVQPAGTAFADAGPRPAPDRKIRDLYLLAELARTGVGLAEHLGVPGLVNRGLNAVLPEPKQPHRVPVWARQNPADQPEKVAIAASEAEKAAFERSKSKFERAKAEAELWKSEQAAAATPSRIAALERMIGPSPGAPNRLDAAIRGDVASNRSAQLDAIISGREQVAPPPPRTTEGAAQMPEYYRVPAPTDATGTAIGTAENDPKQAAFERYSRFMEASGARVGEPVTWDDIRRAVRSARVTGDAGVWQEAIQNAENASVRNETPATFAELLNPDLLRKRLIRELGGPPDNSGDIKLALRAAELERRKRADAQKGQIAARKLIVAIRRLRDRKDQASERLALDALTELNRHSEWAAAFPQKMQSLRAAASQAFAQARAARERARVTRDFRRAGGGTARAAKVLSGVARDSAAAYRSLTGTPGGVGGAGGRGGAGRDQVAYRQAVRNEGTLRRQLKKALEDASLPPPNMRELSHRFNTEGAADSAFREIERKRREGAARAAAIMDQLRYLSKTTGNRVPDVSLPTYVPAGRGVSSARQLE